MICQKERREGVESQVRMGETSVRFLSRKGWVGKAIELRGMIEQEEADLIHTTIFESDLVGRFAACGMGIPVLTSLVNDSYSRLRLRDPNVNRLKLWGASTLDGWTSRHLTTHFHAITRAVKEAAIERLRIPSEKITVIERGRDPMRLGEMSIERRHAARRGLGLKEDSEVLLNVARQEYQKNQALLLHAAADLALQRPSLKVLIAGRRGNATQDLEREIGRLSLAGRVELLGHREDVPELLAAADLFVFPSLYEGLGGALIEAMGMGLPIVATRIPAISEVVEEGENALLVDPESPNGLAAAITILLSDPEMRRRFGRRSREIFLDRFTLDKSIRRMTELYQNLVGTA